MPDKRHRHLRVFLVVGILTVCLDFLLYMYLVAQELFAFESAKAVGFICGTVFSYLANRFWTFSDRTVQTSSILLFVCLYVVTLGINVGINGGVIKVLGDTYPALQIAFVCATGCSAALNFLGMKYVVFRTSPSRIS